jgi:hypothetical protein
MANDARRVSQLTVTTSVSANDRLVVLTNPASSVKSQTVTVNNFIKSAANNFPIANSSQRGVVAVDNITITAAANGTIAANTLNFGYVSATDVRVSNNIAFSDSTSQTTAFQKVTAPTSSTSTGSVGQIAWDDSYIYICVSTNLWKRVALNLTSW